MIRKGRKQQNALATLLCRGGVARKKYFPRDENLFSSARTDFFLGRFFLYSFPIKSFPKANILTSNCPLVITNFKNSLTTGFLLLPAVTR